ncbi:hypothetical protein [Teredinibacter haidensis]|uniref:hypothetical protein n=1 Tax=Teredinibacter haidensis TaxID=2731755 RepID=UPI000948AA20|nr:hypothetical protein [Teredinibacter haidensis]
MGIKENIKSEDTIDTAVRYENPKAGHWFSKSQGRKLYIEPTALAYLANLNGYDQHQVCKGIEELASVPAPQDGVINTLRPTFF